MLRPEQLQVAEVPADAAAQGSQGDACYGAVTDTDFGGSVCVLSVRLLRGTGAAVAAPAVGWDEPLLVHSAGMHAPALGAMVRITVAGQAHVFSALRVSKLCYFFPVRGVPVFGYICVRCTQDAAASCFAASLSTPLSPTP
jgi:hypothetical protein